MLEKETDGQKFQKNKKDDSKQTNGGTMRKVSANGNKDRNKAPKSRESPETTQMLDCYKQGLDQHSTM